MPIKGLSESRRLPRLGKIHTGIKLTKTMPGGKEVTYPSAVDYFVFPEDNPYYKDLVKTFGEKPKVLRIMIPVEDEERWCSQYYRAYSQSRGLICKGNGDTAVRMVDARTGAIADHNSTEVVMKEITCQGRDCPEYERVCREIMNLQFLLPEIPGLGIWQIDTSSINSIKNINSASELVKRIYGHISMIPLLLSIEQATVQDSEGKKRTVNILNLGTNRSLIQMMESLTKPTPEMLTQGDAELPVPDDEVPEMIIPQVQKEKVLPQVEEKKDTRAKEVPKSQPKKATTPVPQPSPPEPAVPDEDPISSMEERRKVVHALRALGKTDAQIRDDFQNITGKKGDWRQSDIAKLLEYASSLKSPEEKADDLFKELSGA